MADSAPKMKIGIGADTQDFDKGAREVKQQMKDLNKVSSDAFSAIGNALGVDTGKLQQFSNAVGGLGNKLKSTGNEGAAAFGKILSAIGPIGGAIAGLGIATATAAFKLLNSEAEAFKNTVEGANIALATTAYIETFKQALHDWNKEIGQGTAQVEATAKKASGTFWANVKQYLISGAFGEAMEGVAGGMALNPNFADAFNEYSAAIADATGKAEEAADKTDEIYQLERQRVRNAATLAELDKQIQEQLSIARDKTQDTADRQAAMAQVENLLAQKRAISVPLEQRLAELYEERSNLATDSVEAENATVAQKVRALEVDRAITQEGNAYLRLRNEINATLAQEEFLAKKAADATRNIPRLKSITGDAEMQVEVPVVLAEPQNVEEIKEEFVDLGEELSSIFEDFTNKMAESIGELTANLINGEQPWQNFANSAISAFGDMAISVGKLAISTGYATLGIQTALESLNGWVAIAAGVALVALGSAVKAGMANIAAGNYSSGAGVAVATTSSSIGNDYESRDVYVNVQGTLRADGDQLVAVIQNTNHKNTVTT